MPKHKIEKSAKKRDNVLSELFRAMPKLKNLNLKKIRKDLESKYWN